MSNAGDFFNDDDDSVCEEIGQAVARQPRPAAEAEAVEAAKANHVATVDRKKATEEDRIKSKVFYSVEVARYYCTFKMDGENTGIYRKFNIRLKVGCLKERKYVLFFKKEF